jgi:hypothetical protein
LATFGGLVCSDAPLSFSGDLGRFFDASSDNDFALIFPCKGEEGPGCPECSRDEEGTGGTTSLLKLLVFRPYTLELRKLDVSRGTGISERLEGKDESGSRGIGGGRRLITCGGVDWAS